MKARPTEPNGEEREKCCDKSRDSRKDDREMTEPCARASSERLFQAVGAYRHHIDGSTWAIASNARKIGGVCSCATGL